MNDKLKQVIKMYRATGRIAFIHPRNKTISLNGGRELPYDVAFTRMTECLASKAISL